MATINKQDFIDSEMNEKFTAKKKDLEFIRETNNEYFKHKGPDKRSIFCPLLFV